MSRARGALREGWVRHVGDYARAAAWFAPGDTILVGDASGAISAFASRTGELRWVEPDAHPGGVLALSAAPGAPLALSGGADGRVWCWGPHGAVGAPWATEGPGWVGAIAWSPDGRTAAAARGRTVCTWGANGIPQHQSGEHPSTVSALTFVGPDTVAAAAHGGVFLHDPAGRRPPHHLAWRGAFLSLVASPDRAILAASTQDNTVHFWRLSTGEDAQMTGYPTKPTALAFDHRSHFLATGGGADLTLWPFHGDGPEGAEPITLSLHAATIRALAFAHRDLRLASADATGGLVLWGPTRSGSWAPAGGAKLPATVEALAWRPDDRALLAIDGSGGVNVWRTGD